MIYDFRSDTVTQPSSAMRVQMAQAQVGDDVYGDDPTVNQLNCSLAERLGFAAGLFLPSGVQSNLCALLSHCQRGDEYLVGALAHTYRYEGGGAAVLGSIQPQPIAHAHDMSLALSDIREAIKPNDVHFARTRLLCLENTIYGHVLSLEYQRSALAIAREHGLATHLDGARLFNAACALGCEPSAICLGFDSVSVCLSKGLGAPIGSVLLGSTELIENARRWRKMLGGGWRQAGGLAAAALYALEHNVTRLKDDHANARLLAQGLEDLGLKVDPPETNMVWCHPQPDTLVRLHAASATAPFRLTLGRKTRLVTHLDTPTEAIHALLDFFRQALQ